ncbi:helix-turn-helix transcriptional regulator [uncultured Psychroserpens sp.]|uniref:helix-turn-helix domain-containing protein n=1 Tax=uncultured Psychroserpens sp. TaxID=255436 RepID=UPI0026247FF2|nr:helix-turn-helix transcriptional regulator [uncultured Psychroserpens sp.]
MNIKTIREKKHLTQEELAEQSGLSIRTIQRIEAGQKPKGHTAKVLAKTLGLDLSSLNKPEKLTETVNYSLVKRINLSTAFVCFIPLLNIILPLALTYHYKQNNNLTKGIVTLQILWSIVSTLIFFISGFLKLTFDLHHQTTLWVAIILIVINLVMILINSANIDKHKELYFKLRYNLI